VVYRTKLQDIRYKIIKFYNILQIWAMDEIIFWIAQDQLNKPNHQSTSKRLIKI